MKKESTNKTLYEALILFLMALVAYGYFSSERDPNINSRLALIKAVVEEGRFEIDSFHNTELYTNDKAYFNGHYYSDKAVGTAVLGALAYYPLRWLYYQAGLILTPRLFREWITFLVVSLPTALIAPLLYMLIKHITASKTKSLIISLSIALGTPLFKYGTALYGHALAAVLYFSAFSIWYHARRRGSISVSLAFTSAFLLGFTVLAEFPTLVLVLLVSPYILFALHQSRQLTDWKIFAAMAAGFLLPLCFQFYYNGSVFGGVFNTGYSHEYDPGFRAAHGTGFMGIGLPDLRVFYYLTFQPSLGIFWQSPIFFLALIGCFFMMKHRVYRAELCFATGLLVVYPLFFSGYFDWQGGVVFSPRHLIPILPFLALPLAFLPEKYSIPIWLSGAVSVFQNLVMAASGTHGLYEYIHSLIQDAHIVGGKGMLFYEVCLPNLINGFLTNNRGIQFFGLQGPSSLLPLLMVESVLLIIFWRLTKIGRRVP